MYEPNLLNDFRNSGVPFTLNLGEGVGWKNNDARNTFANLYNYNAPFTIPDSVVNGYRMFENCYNLNSPITINPFGNLQTMYQMFVNCDNFNQDVNIPINCASFQNFYRRYSGSQTYDGTVHLYSNCGPHGPYQGEGNLAWAFQGMSGFNGNVVFHNIYPWNFYSGFQYDESFNRNVVLPDSMTMMAYAFSGCYNLDQNVHIPTSINNGYYMFSSCYNLNKNIYIPDGIVDASYAFAYCYNLNQAVHIPSMANITAILYDCENLNKPIHVPYFNSSYSISQSGSVTASSNGNSLFTSCYNLNSMITFNDGIEVLYETFGSCRNFNQNITLPSSLKVANRTFVGCYMALNQNIQLPEGLIAMVNTFQGCSLLNQSIGIPSTVRILTGAFQSCTTLNQPISIPDGCIRTDAMFSACYNFNQSVYIPTSVTNTGAMFNGCTNLNKPITIPSSVIYCSSMFNGCTNYYVDEGVIPMDCNSFSYTYANTKVINLNVQNSNFLWSQSNVISLAKAVDVAGKTKSPVNNYEDLPSSHEEWVNFNFGIPIGHAYFKSEIRNNVRIFNILGRSLYNGFAAYQAKMDNINNQYPPGNEYREAMLNQWNHGGLEAYSLESLVNGVIYNDQAVFYLDYPNASDADHVNWYYYNVAFI